MKKINKSLILKAKKGNPKSQHELAFEYWSGENLKKDYSEAMRLWKLSASKGFAKAYYNLGCMYMNGWGTHINYKKSYYYFNLSIKQKHTYQSTSYFILGQKFYLDGRGGKKNIKKGIKYVNIATKKNNVIAQYLLGSYYDDSTDISYNIKKDNAMAFKYYKMAADNKFIQALHQIATMYIHGRGVDKNLTKAYKYLNIIETTDNDKLINDFSLLPDAQAEIKKMANKQKLKVAKFLFQTRKRIEKNPELEKLIT